MFVVYLLTKLQNKHINCHCVLKATVIGTVTLVASRVYFCPLMRIVHRATSRQLLAKDEFPRAFAEEAGR